MLKHLVIDNVLRNPDSIVKWAKECRFFSTDEMSYRTPTLGQINNQLFLQTVNNIVDRVLNVAYYTTAYEYSYNINAHFEYITSKLNSKNSSIHNESSLFTGIVYLSKNPPENTGTLLYDSSGNVFHNIENKYNRLLLFNSGYLCSTHNGFGDNIDDSRLTLICFVNTFSMNVKR